MNTVQSLTEQFTHLTGLADAENLTRRSLENIKAVSEASAVLARGMQEASQLWFGWKKLTLRVGDDLF